MARSTIQRLGTTSKPSTSRETLDHLDPPSGIVHGPAQLLAAIGAVGEDRRKERKEPAGLAMARTMKRFAAFIGEIAAKS